jgi:hypothetical protein
MRLQEAIPRYDFSSRHERVLAASASAVRNAALDWQPRESWLWRVLLLGRGLGSPKGSVRRWAGGQGFLCLEDSEDEIVYAQAGQFWALRERGALVSPRTPEEFAAIDDPRVAVAAMALRFESLGPDRTRLSTETRIRALGPQARRRFRIYWLLIGPFSGLLRGAMLRGIAKHAEANARAATIRS